jgi:hypothetical protein
MGNAKADMVLFWIIGGARGSAVRERRRGASCTIPDESWEFRCSPTERSNFVEDKVKS